MALILQLRAREANSLGGSIVVPVENYCLESRPMQPLPKFVLKKPMGKNRPSNRAGTTKSEILLKQKSIPVFWLRRLTGT